MPATTPQVQLTTRHLSNTTLTAPLLAGATQATFASGTIFDTLPLAGVLTDSVNVEVISVDSVASGTTYNISRAIEPGTSSPGSFPANATIFKATITAEHFRRIQRAFRERTTGVVNVLEYGAKGDAVSATGTITSGNVTLNSSNFAVGDVGQTITIRGAGAAGADLVTTIAGRSSTTVVTLTAPAGTTVTSAFVIWGIPNIGPFKTSKVSIASGSTTCTLVGPWTSADVGKPIVVQAAGGSATAPLVTTISGFSSGLLITLAAGATSTATDQNFTYGTDDTAAFQAALATLGAGRGGRLTVPPATYMLTGTLVIPSHSEFWGTSVGFVPRLTTDLDFHAGTCLVWAGATNTPMVKLFNVQGVLVHGIAVNAENVAGVTGFLLDSDNTISSQQNVVEYWAAWNCPVAFQWGTHLGGVDTQNDTVNLRRFWIAAPTLAATALGIVVNTANSQISRIEHGIIQSINKGIHLQRCGGIITIDRVAFGAITTPGSNATCIQTSQFVAEVLLSNCQAESCTYFLRALDRIQDADAPGGANLQTITLLTCHLDTPILVTGGQTLITIGCSASQPAGVANLYVCNSSLSNIISIGDVLNNSWTMTAGTLWQFATFLNASVVATPTTNFPFMQVGGGTVVRKHLSATLSITGATWGAIAQDATVTQNITVTGAAVGDTCTAVPDAALAPGLVWNAVCTAINTVTLRMTNTAGSQTPATATWRATVLGY